MCFFFDLFLIPYINGKNVKNGVFLCFFGFFWKKGKIYMVFFWFFWFLIFVCDFWYLILMVKIKKTWKIWKKWNFDKKRCQKSYYKSIFLRFLFIFIFTINIRYQNWILCEKRWFLSCLRGQLYKGFGWFWCKFDVFWCFLCFFWFIFIELVLSLVF